MRPARALLLGLLSLSLGCLNGQTVHKTAWLKRAPFSHSAPQGEDLVVMYVALLEVPVGDRYINDELWGQVDEQVVGLELKPILEENGLRVAQVAGIIPTRLRALLTSDRSCINPHRLLLHAGATTTLHLGPTQPFCQFELHEGGETREIALKKAQCAVLVKPALTRDGRTKLRFVPRVEHGDTHFRPRPSKDSTGVLTWEQQEERPAQTFDALAWDVVLAPNEYVLIGARYDRPGTLGQQSFICRDPQAPAQRLLAIRTARSVEAIVPAAVESEEADAEPRPAPLALQASLGGAGTRLP